MANLDKIRQRIATSIAIKQQLLADTMTLSNVVTAANLIENCFRKGGKVLFGGNGGSASDAQHLACELSGRFYKDRPPLYAEALHVNTSYLTAVANDYSYEEVYRRIVQAKGRAGDVLVAISTSGNSPNIIKAIEEAKRQNMRIIGLTGAGKGAMNALCDVLLEVPSLDTPRIQECHILLGHIICEQVEAAIFP
jgi:D-sedoheptulose 7-phosphate isomerase